MILGDIDIATGPESTEKAGALSACVFTISLDRGRLVAVEVPAWANESVCLALDWILLGDADLFSSLPSGNQSANLTQMVGCQSVRLRENTRRSVAAARET